MHVNRNSTFTQVRGIVYEYFFWFCDSTSRDICLGLLYGYKALLQVIALVFSFSIRKVKIKGLNDAKSIALAVYVTSTVTAVIIVSFYSLKEYLNVYATLFCLGFFIGTTAILCLIFIPKVYMHSSFAKFKTNNIVILSIVKWLSF